MLVTIKNIDKAKREPDLAQEIGDLDNLEVQYEDKFGILWKYIRSNATPHFSTELLDDIRTVQKHVRARQASESLVRPQRIAYVVFASKIPGVFNLGGDLRLFRRLIAQQDRAGLVRYSKKATDSVFYHASNFGDALSFSLVQGIAMGGGFEAALAGNILVAEKGTMLGFPEVLFGLFPGMGAYTLLRRKVGAFTAEQIILSAKNYTAEELYELGVVDVLCDRGEGEETIRSYASRHASRRGVSAFRRALNHAHTIDRKELYGIADSWVETAMRLDSRDLRNIDRLIANQAKSFPHIENSYQPEEMAAAG